jgi:hypothetical protein
MSDEALRRSCPVILDEVLQAALRHQAGGGEDLVVFELAPRESTDQQ